MKKAGHRPYKDCLGFKMDGSSKDSLKSQSFNDNYVVGIILSIVSWYIYESMY
jgi:hypothetical protein